MAKDHKYVSFSRELTPFVKSKWMSISSEWAASLSYRLKMKMEKSYSWVRKDYWRRISNFMTAQWNHSIRQITQSRLLFYVTDDTIVKCYFCLGRLFVQADFELNERSISYGQLHSMIRYYMCEGKCAGACYTESRVGGWGKIKNQDYIDRNSSSFSLQFLLLWEGVSLHQPTLRCRGQKVVARTQNAKLPLLPWPPTSGSHCFSL